MPFVYIGLFAMDCCHCPRFQRTSEVELAGEGYKTKEFGLSTTGVSVTVLWNPDKVEKMTSTHRGNMESATALKLRPFLH